MLHFSKIYKEDLDIVGKKAVELAEIARLGISIPDGFVITTIFFNKFLKQTGIDEKIKEVQKLNHPAISESIEKLFDPIKKQIMRIPIPENLALELHRFYKELSRLFKESSLNIFSSSPDNNKSVMFKNVKGDANLVLKIKEIWALHINNPVAIIVQKNITSKTKGTVTTHNSTKELEQIAKKIQKHFYFPQELDYVIEKGKIFITQIRPLTGSIEELNKIKPLKGKTQKILIKGVPINPGIATGPVKILRKNYEIVKVKSGEIIVLPHLKISYEEIKNAKAVVIDDGLLNPYDKMLYRKVIKIPTIIGTKNAAKILQNGNIVTVNGMSGEIYSGGFI